MPLRVVEHSQCGIFDSFLVDLFLLIVLYIKIKSRSVRTRIKVEFLERREVFSQKGTIFYQIWKTWWHEEYNRKCFSLELKIKSSPSLKFSFKGSKAFRSVVLDMVKRRDTVSPLGIRFLTFHFLWFQKEKKYEKYAG